jgi:biotin operon repressor
VTANGRRRCPRCGAFLAADNEGPRCSPCERVILTAEILRAIAAADAAPAPVVRPHTPIGVQADTMLRALRSGPKTGQELAVALHMGAIGRVAIWKRLRRCSADLRGRGYEINVGARCAGGYELLDTIHQVGHPADSQPKETT